MRIWQRHLYRKLIQTFFFFLFCAFAIYVIVDLSVHGVRFFSNGTGQEICLYYVFTFSSLLELFIPLTFLLSIMRILSDLNAHGELTALQMAGLSKKRLLTPFFVFAGFLSLVCYANGEWITPMAQDQTGTFRSAYKTKKKDPSLYSISLKDDSEFVYQFFDPEKNELFDVFWVRGGGDIWHMQSLQIAPRKGKKVHHFTRNEENKLIRAGSYEEFDFPEIALEPPFHKFVPFGARALSTLFAQGALDSTERPSIFAYLSYKLATGLIPLLLLFGVSPLFLRFSRSQPLFLTAAFCLFGLIALKLILDGMLILGENQVLPPILSIWGPMVLLFAIRLPSFAKLK